MNPAIVSGADLLRILGVVSVALCLIPAGAHLFEIPTKLALPPGEYMIVQRIYAGWALFGIAVLAALAFTLAHTILVWRLPVVRWISLLALTLILATQAVFWIWTQPMNELTRSWTVVPEDLDAVRRQWEYAHAANAVITLVALVLITIAIIAGARAESTALQAEAERRTTS